MLCVCASFPGISGSRRDLTETSGKADLRGCTVFAPSLDYISSTMQLTLSIRGWVLQGKLLSPRILHFAEDRIFWEYAEKESLSEALPSGLPGPGHHFFPPDFSPFNCFPDKTPEHLRLAWSEITRDYSKRDLTYPEKDKLVAISAIARKFAAFFGGDYYAGHFSTHMPLNLLWSVSAYRPQPTLRRSPTWKWPSVDHEFYHTRMISAWITPWPARKKA